jgi:hypothetical protein
MNSVVTSVNEMPDQGTSLHFHGVHQINTNDQDGTVSIITALLPFYNLFYYIQGCCLL